MTETRTKRIIPRRYDIKGRFQMQGGKIWIYLSRVLCLCVCVSQFVAERSAILLVLVLKLTKETRQRDRRWRDRSATDHGGRVWRDFSMLKPNQRKRGFTVPPAVALLNYISSGILWRIFCQTRTFRGFFKITFRVEQRSCDGRGRGRGT